jgi:purine-cytosine permease-like protein
MAGADFFIHPNFPGMTQENFTEQLDAINEYEREPVPEHKTKTFRSFVNMMAGEHIAGTEFVIGPLFVLHGVSAPDVFLGLLVGNLLAVLSYTFICGPVSVRTRLTIFYQLEKICGYRLVSIFNSINGIQACALGASMIAVSGTAIGLLLDLPTPGLTDFYLTDWTWIGLVVLIGSVMTAVSILGYDQVARFAAICAPWMPLVFVAAAVAVLPQLGVTSWSNFWEVANTKIWTGVPVAGQSKWTFWHILFFAWLCNTALHIGLGDMSLYRYARRAWYGVASVSGMFLGHFVAWISSGILCAVVLQSGNANPSPGQIAFAGAGVAGTLCVVIAGWTAANPTLYRAGLAVQALWPGLKRWKATLVVGILSMVLATLPGVVSRLDQVLAFYALVAAPVGAVMVLDIYVFPRIGLIPNYAERTGRSFNWAVALTWLLSMLFGYALYLITQSDFFFFMAIPGWFIGAILYVVLSRTFQRMPKKQPQTEVLA